jgi:2-polyprenyl-3-methyl-5-hydroxy-6-metoxy-1,4-benzoquinol methylase
MNDPKDHDSDPRVAEAWRQIYTQSESAVRSGDAASIKQLYDEIGGLLSDAYGAENIPLLSLPETLPVVTGLLDDISGTILDAGCGPNPRVAITLARRADRRIVGMDIGLEMVKLARQRVATEGVVLLAVVGDVEVLPFSSGVFDAIVCDDTMEHLPDDAAAVREFARTLKAGARAVIATPNRTSLAVIWRKVRDRVRGVRRAPSDYYVVNAHLREYTWAELERLVRNSFAIRRRAAVGWSGGPVRRFATFLTARGPLRRGSRMIVIDAQKLEQRTP